MKNIPFTHGTIQKSCSQYFEVNLYNKDGKKVYSCLADLDDFFKITNKHKSIKIIK